MVWGASKHGKPSILMYRVVGCSAEAGPSTLCGEPGLPYLGGCFGGWLRVGRHVGKGLDITKIHRGYLWGGGNGIGLILI